MSWVMLGWGGVGVLTFCLVRTINVATLPRSLECLLHCYAAEISEIAFYVTCCYAAKISGMLATLHVATLPRSLECFLRYMLLRCRDLWNACYIATLPRSLECLLRCRDLMLYAKMWQWRFVISTRNCFRRLQTCCKSSSEKRMPHFVRSKWRRNLCLCFTVTKTTFPQKTPKFGRPNLSLFQWHK